MSKNSSKPAFGTDGWRAIIAKDYTVTGGNIKNIIQFAWLLSKRNNKAISEHELLIGIRRELAKEGKSVEI